MITRSQTSSINRPLRRTFLLITFVSITFLPIGKAVTPAPDGGYPNHNTAEGEDALFTAPNVNNTALGYHALHNNNGGKENTAVGSEALVANTTGTNNTATGHAALMGSIISNKVNSGGNNTGDGEEALTSIVDGSDNTATGYRALLSMISGINNTATGSLAMRYNSGSFNTAIGMEALRGGINPNNNQGNFNTATGYQALTSNAGGGANTADGFDALLTNIWGWNNTATGCYALLNATGSFNIGLGQRAGAKLTTGGWNIDIGNQGVAGEAQTIRIGDNNQTRTFIAGIRNTTTLSGTLPVVIDANGQLGAAGSSERFKKDIKPMDRSSDAVLQLKPVTFHYKNDSTNTSQFGLVAEEVEKINPDLIVRDAEGKVHGVRYDAVNAMLLNEFLKQHSKVENLQATALEQQEVIAALTATLKEQAAQIKKVSARIEVKPAPQRVAKNR
jgi:hypothetical protein